MHACIEHRHLLVLVGEAVDKPVGLGAVDDARVVQDVDGLVAADVKADPFEVGRVGPVGIWWQFRSVRVAAARIAAPLLISCMWPACGHT